MLTAKQVSEAAVLLSSRLGEIAIAAAIFRAQEAARRGSFAEMVDWRRIAERSYAVQRPTSARDRDDEHAASQVQTAAPSLMRAGGRRKTSAGAVWTGMPVGEA
jgi:hypothetical protein